MHNHSKYLPEIIQLKPKHYAEQKKVQNIGLNSILKINIKKIRTALRK